MQKFEGDTRSAQIGTDNYDPEEHRPPGQLTSCALAIFSLTRLTKCIRRIIRHVLKFDTILKFAAAPSPYSCTS